MYQSYAVPISVKGIVFEDGKVWLRQNERGEWELPGGKLDPGEQHGEAGPAEFRAFDATEIHDLTMPEFYKQAIGQVI